MSDVSRVVADKAEIGQIVVPSVCRDSCGDKLPSVGFELMDHVGENRQMISLSRTDEVDETTDNQDHGVVVTSCSVMSDTAPSPARNRRQLDVVPKEIGEPTNYVLDPDTPCLSRGIAICDDVDNSLMTSPSAVTR